jgi:hypothetical protein
MPSKIQVDQIAGATGSTVTLPSGQTLDLSSGTVTLPSTALSALNATNLTSGTVPSARLSLTSSDLPTVPTTKGGTGLTTIGTASQVLRVNSGATALEFATAPSGKILQVISSTKTATQSHNGNGENNPEEYISIGLSVAITPSSASSKILIFANVMGASSNNAFMTILRGTSATTLGSISSNTNLAVPDSPSSRQPCFAGDFYHLGSNAVSKQRSVTFLDSPSTTSERIYEIGISIHSTAVFYINRSDIDTNAGWQPRAVSTLTLMEIGA